MNRRDPFVKEEGGFTTPAAAVALLLVCALLFMCVDGYRVGARSGQIQYVADAGALAADAVVADFVTAGQVVDAALLSLSLLGVSAYAAAAVASFIPGGGAVASRFATVGGKLLKVRDKFAKSAAKGLKKVQKAIPALCAVRASQVVQANARAAGERYAGIAFANPASGAAVEIADDTKVDEAVSKLDEESEEAQSKSAGQKEAQEQLDAAKERAWRADCGSEGMCMRERAGRLAGLSGSLNPNYSSPDTWGFSVPLARAKAYYRARRAQEAGSGYGGRPDEVAESIARKKFYGYALSRVSEGSVRHSDSGGELPDLKALARNTAQIRGTYLYTEEAYPVSENGGTLVLHAWTGCPGYAAGVGAGQGSVKGIDEGSFSRCETCMFSATTLGRVPSASTSIGNGFEYYYRIVVEAAQDYSEAQRKSERLRSELDETRAKMARAVKKALKAIAGQRYDPQPPGRYGCVCLVVAPGERARGLPFVNGGAARAARIAISGATLAPDEASDQGTIVSGIAEGLIPSGRAGSATGRAVLSAWGKALQAYSDGNDAAIGLFDSVLSKVPLVGNDLSSWATSSFRSAIDDAGLAPCDLTTYKPVLANTSQVMGRGGGRAARVLKGLKRAVDLESELEAGDLEAMLETLGACPDLGSRLSDGKLVIATIPFSRLGGGLRDAEVTVSAPSELQELYDQAVESVKSLMEAG